MSPTFHPARTLARVAAVALGVVLVAGCSGKSTKKSAVTPVIKASDVTAAIKAYQQSFDTAPRDKVCAELFPESPAGMVGTDAGGVAVSVQAWSDALTLTCDFIGDHCDAKFYVAETSSGRDDPKGLKPYLDHFSDSGDDNGVQISVAVGSSSSVADGCKVSVEAAKSSIPFLNDALARVAGG